MSQSTLTSKGQTTVPREVRDDLDLEAGVQLIWVKTPQGYLVKPRDNSVRRLGGILKYDGPPLTEEVIEARLAAAFAEKYLP
jgi:antitoxin PrlF